MRILPNGQSIQYGKLEWISIGGRCLWAQLVETVDELEELCMTTNEGVTFTVHPRNVTVLDPNMIVEQPRGVIGGQR